MLALVGLLGAACTARQQTHPSKATAASPAIAPAPGRYLQEALDVMQSHALNRATLDWPKIRQRATNAANGAAAVRDVYPAIELAIGMLNDNGHSSLVPVSSDKSSSSPIITASQLPVGQLLPEQLAYVELPGDNAADAERDQQAAPAWWL